MEPTKNHVSILDIELTVKGRIKCPFCNRSKEIDLDLIPENYLCTSCSAVLVIDKSPLEQEMLIGIIDTKELRRIGEQDNIHIAKAE